MSDHTIRDAEPDDAPALHAVAAAAWRDAHAPIVGEATVEEFLDDYYTKPDLREATRHESTIFLVAEADEPVGFVEVGPIDEPGVWSVYRLYVHPDHFEEGFGTELLRAVESRLRDTDAKRLRLTVMADNERAVGFYEARGFERVETRESDLDTTDHVYEKPLDGTA